MANETENQMRLRRAKGAISYCQAAEVEARKALASAIESTKRAREKYTELFIAEESRERNHKIAEYNHATN